MTGGYSFLSDRRRDLLIEIFLPGFYICDVTSIFLIELFLNFDLISSPGWGHNVYNLYFSSSVSV